MVGPKRAVPPRKKRPTPTSVPSAEEKAQEEVKPEEIALPPSRMTTLDVDKPTETSALVEEAKENEVDAEVPKISEQLEPINTEPLGHARLQSIATDSIAESEEVATPPPRSITPSEVTEEDDGLSLDKEVQDTMEGVQS